MALSSADMPWLAPGPAAAVKTMRVRVVMAFLLKAERQEIGSELTLPVPLAQELIGYRKVEKIIEPAAPDAEMPPNPSAPAATRGRRKPKE